MAKEIENRWGESNPKRGAYRQEALQFIKDFPIGSVLTNEAFDKWGHDNGYIVVPFGAEKQSDAWLAHLTRRNQLRSNIFKSSTHTSMMDNGQECFVITRSGDSMIVERPDTALQQLTFANRLDTLISTKRRQLGYLMQSTDMSQLPPHHRAIAEALYDDISDWNEVVRMQTKQLDAKFTKLVKRIAFDVESGIVKPTNHAITNMLANVDLGAGSDEAEAA